MVVHGEPLCRHISATSSSGCTSLSTVPIPEAPAKAEALAISLSSCSGNLKSSATDGALLGMASKSNDHHDHVIHVCFECKVMFGCKHVINMYCMFVCLYSMYICTETACMSLYVCASVFKITLKRQNGTECRRHSSSLPGPRPA